MCFLFYFNSYLKGTRPGSFSEGPHSSSLQTTLPERKNCECRYPENICGIRPGVMEIGTGEEWRSVPLNYESKVPEETQSLRVPLPPSRHLALQSSKLPLWARIQCGCKHFTPGKGVLQREKRCLGRSSAYSWFGNAARESIAGFPFCCFCVCFLLQFRLLRNSVFAARAQPTAPRREETWF